MLSSKAVFTALWVAAAPAIAHAQVAPTAAVVADEPPSAVPSANLPAYAELAQAVMPPVEPSPAVAAPATDDPLADPYLIRYASAGTFELGASAGLMIANGFRNVNISPMFGWFVSDQIELSAILGASNVKAGAQEATVYSALAEASYHTPFNPNTFGFLGLGVGGAYIDELGGGLAVVPRIGANVVVGDWGVLSPSLSYEYTTHSAKDISDEMPNGVAMVALSSALRVNIGYTATW